MSWQISFSKESLKFIDKNKNIDENEIISYVVKAIKKLKGAQINIDIKKMKGEWENFYRLRIGEKRILFQINFNNEQIYIDRIDFRENVYK